MILFSKRLELAQKHGFQMTAEFNALLADVEEYTLEKASKLCGEIHEMLADGKTVVCCRDAVKGLK